MSNSSDIRTCQGCGYQWPRSSPNESNHDCEFYLGQEIESLRKRVRDLEALATVYDATVALLVALAGGMDSLDEIAKSQVEAARAACLEITGEPSMVGFSRYNQPTELS